MVRTIDATQSKRTAPSPDDETLTIKVAADLLNVDRRYLSMLLDAGEIPATGKGSQRHVRRADLIAYKTRRDTERRATLDELTRQSEDAGLYDADYSSIVTLPF